MILLFYFIINISFYWFNKSCKEQHKPLRKLSGTNSEISLPNTLMPKMKSASKTLKKSSWWFFINSLKVKSTMSWRICSELMSTTVVLSLLQNLATSSSKDIVDRWACKESIKQWKCQKELKGKWLWKSSQDWSIMPTSFWTSPAPTMSVTTCSKVWTKMEMDSFPMLSTLRSLRSMPAEERMKYLLLLLLQQNQSDLKDSVSSEFTSGPC